MPNLQFLNGLLRLGRATPALQNMGGDLSKAIGKSVDVAPKKLSGVWRIRTMYTLKATISNYNVLSLSSPSFAIRFRKSTDFQLLHKIVKVIRQ